MTNLTGYQRVREILDKAAGHSKADYLGQGKFWHKDLAEFLTTSLDGIPLIAPRPVAVTCCGTPKAESVEPVSDVGRGAASGLIKGLRGETPFDGSRFPRLPWGGGQVASPDIDFISDWIDDGCPEGNPLSLSIAGLKPSFPVLQVIQDNNVEKDARFVFGIESTATDYQYQQGELKQRRNIDCLTPAQLNKYRQAFRQLYELNKWPEDYRNYNNLALIHQNHCQHGWERFLPWHRIYLYEFEQALQDVCPDVTLPYWDWTMPQYWPEHPDQGMRIPQSLQAFLTEESLAYLATAVPPIPAPQIDILRRTLVAPVPKTFYSQSTFFKAIADSIGPEYATGPHRKRFIDALLASNSLWYPLRYPGEYPGGKTINQTVHYHYPTAADIDQILSLRTFHDFGGGSIYNDSFGFLDQNPHNTMHLWTGGMNPEWVDPSQLTGDAGTARNRGVLVANRKFHSREDLYSQPQYGDMFSNLTASFDPVFWPVHSNVDRLWHEWQTMHPNSLPADLDAVLTPWSYTIADTLDMSRFGYEYVKCSFMIPIGLAIPVGRFDSARLDLPAPVLANKFQRAEVRLHRVPQLPRSCFIRVFLNLPGASASTDINDEHYAGYVAVFGHGPCIGGPGHCATPPVQPRKYDQRPRSHNTPRNHRVDVTRAVQERIKAGDKSLQITLVVIGADYQQDNELLKLDGVSLNFLD